MFFKPEISAKQLAAAGQAECSLYSDMHKDAFGCRPGVPQNVHYSAMSKFEREIEHATIAAFIAEDDRISGLRTEVARFDFSRRMEYLMRREGVSEREAFIAACRSATSHPESCDPTDEWFSGFDSVCYEWNLPFSDAKVLKAKWKELNS